MAQSHSRKYSAPEKEEAQVKMRTQVMYKEYWTVTDYQDNGDDLQEIIDILYNSIEGNDYVVEYTENQNGTRLVISCKVCGKDLTSYDPFLTHENGKNHKKVRQKMLTVADPNLESELEIQPLNKTRGTFAEGSLEDQIDATTYNVLGVQFVYKEVIDGRDTYTCQLCERCANVYQISASRMLSHLTSTGHNENYMKAKFGYIKKSNKDYEDECCFIAEFEGKIHANIADLTPQYSSSKSSKGSRHRPRSRSVSPSTSDRIPKPPKIESLVALVDDSSDVTVAEEPPKPDTSDKGVTADITEARFILHEVNAMQEADCQMILQEDSDMQDLLTETLWVLTNKMEKYYSQTGAIYNEGRTKTPLTVCADKMKQYIAKFAELK